MRSGKGKAVVWGLVAEYLNWQQVFDASMSFTSDVNVDVDGDDDDDDDSR